MSVMERLYDNDWYVSHAAPSQREALEADVTRAWMVREASVEDVERARTVSTISPARSALALSLGNVVQAEYDRARARLLEASRCTDIVDGHAFTVRREIGQGGAMTVEITSCTLLRRASLSTTGRGQQWTAVLHDPERRNVASFSTSFGTDPWGAFHRACEWITTGLL
jgi:hypothetical protein